MSKSKSQNDGSIELENYVRSLSETEGVHSIAVAKESLLEEGALIIKVHADLSDVGSVDDQKRLQFAGDQTQAVVYLESWGMGSPFEVPIFLEGQVAVEDGVKFLKQYARDPKEANLYDLVLSEDE
ncbi:hypothetical protein [Halostagnicola kamekurae]|uniref:Uncharacterized protein n=1 Tax=Halostagnicola kamekurae TaxID=619731 RepID=A0A1I6UTF4_9EURY|nr:hypothetical protein [Halostagnicola kamekurae]SFT04673.1 hypothetical protein SAMN04488556_4078 [Halostagnicola kamekurae]